MSNPASISGVDLTTPQGRQILQDALDVLYGLIQKAGGVAAGPTTFDELRVRMLTVLGTINVVPEDKPPANVNSRLVTPWLTGQRGRGEVWRFEDQNDGGDLLEVRSQPYLVGTPTATSGDWEFRFTSAQRDPAGAYRSLGAIRFGSDGRIRTYNASEVLQFDSTLALTSPVGPTNGGTGLTSYATGDTLYASATNVLSKRAIGTEGQVYTVASGVPTWATLASTGLPTRHISGLVIRYASSSTVTVSAGKARNKADTADMTLSSQVTVDLTSTNAALGVERKTLTGTASFTNTSTTVTGSGTSFLSEFGTRSATGTVSTSGGSTWTGSGTKFLTEVAVNDLVGNSTRGYFRVSAVNSDTSLQTDTNPAGVTSDFSSDSFSVVENPKIETAGGRTYVVEKITSNTALTLLSSTAATATESGVAVYAGGKKCTTGNASDGWRAVWLLSGGSGTTVAFSTQRTTPYLTISGYTTSYRRIGWVRLNASGNIIPAYGADGSFGARWNRYETDVATTGAQCRALANASSTTSWQSFTCDLTVPPTARAIQGLLFSLSPNTAVAVQIRGRGLGDSAVGRQRLALAPSTSGFNSLLVDVPCDGAQYLDHGCQAGGPTGDGSYFDVLAYEDVLE